MGILIVRSKILRSHMLPQNDSLFNWLLMSEFGGVFYNSAICKEKNEIEIEIFYSSSPLHVILNGTKWSEESYSGMWPQPQRHEDTKKNMEV